MRIDQVWKTRSVLHGLIGSSFLLTDSRPRRILDHPRAGPGLKGSVQGRSRMAVDYILQITSASSERCTAHSFKFRNLPPLQIPSECLSSDNKFPVGTIAILRHNVFSPKCSEKNVSDLCLWWQPPQHHHSRRALIEGKHVPASRTLTEAGRCPVDVRSRSADGKEGLPSIRDHPLQYYVLYSNLSDVTEAAIVTKSMHVPDHSLRVNIHYGEAVEVSGAPYECRMLDGRQKGENMCVTTLRNGSMYYTHLAASRPYSSTHCHIVPPVGCYQAGGPPRVCLVGACGKPDQYSPPPTLLPGSYQAGAPARVCLVGACGKPDQAPVHTLVEYSHNSHTKDIGGVAVGHQFPRARGLDKQS